MEKTLKRLLLLIPILIIAFPLKNVYADEPIDIYWASAYGDYQFSSFSSNVNQYTPNSLSFKAYDNDFILHNGFNYGYGNSRNFCFILYDKVNDLYILQCNTWDDANACSKYEDKYYIDIRGITPFCKNSSGSWVTSSNQNNWYAILSIKGENTYFSNITSLTPNISNNGTYYLTQNKKHRSWGEIMTFLKNNYSNFELAGIDNDFILYINSVEVPKITEPEPEIPSIPPYIFNNTKYYVPNYDERNCVEIIDKDTIRVFENEETLNYIDYYINSNYISKKGQVEVNYVKNCSNLQFTNIRYYGNDFPQILFITLVVITFSVGVPYILYKRFRKR